LLVVPDFHGRHPLRSFPRFVDKLFAWKARGCDLWLHGYTHEDSPEAAPVRGPSQWFESRFLTAGEGEFHRLDFDAARKRLNQGLAVFADVLGLRPEGFVPPAWLTNRQADRAIAAAGFAFTEDHRFIEHLPTGKRWLVPAIAFSGRTMARTAASAAFAQAMRLVASAPLDVRFALHPKDFDSSFLVRSIGSLARDLSRLRRPCAYNDLLESMRS
jgi:predicted deacetylase